MHTRRACLTSASVFIPCSSATKTDRYLRLLVQLRRLVVSFIEVQVFLFPLLRFDFVFLRSAQNAAQCCGENRQPLLELVQRETVAFEDAGGK